MASRLHLRLGHPAPLALTPRKAEPGPHAQIHHNTRLALPGVVYLLHFDQPYQHARHYTGWTGDDVPVRLDGTQPAAVPG